MTPDEETPNRRTRRGNVGPRCECGFPRNPGTHSRTRCQAPTPAQRITQIRHGDEIMPGPHATRVGPDWYDNSHFGPSDYFDADAAADDQIVSIRTRPLAGDLEINPLTDGRPFETLRMRLLGRQRSLIDEEEERQLLHLAQAQQRVAEAAQNFLGDEAGTSSTLGEPPQPRYYEPSTAIRAQRHMDEAFADLDQKSKGELLDLIRDMRQDWATLNDIHNRRANRNGWCTEYEERQDRHNEKLRVLKLIGRVSNGPSDDETGEGL